MFRKNSDSTLFKFQIPINFQTSFEFRRIFHPKQKNNTDQHTHRATETFLTKTMTIRASCAAAAADNDNER